MSRESLVMLFGLVVLFMPSIGIPSEWKTYSLATAGILLVILGYSLRRSMYMRTLDRGNGERGTDAFVEHDGSTPHIIVDEAAEPEDSITQQ